jgi:N-dimethylarginine dimethylaminohydrolase
MRNVLFCPPTYFRLIDVKNPFMQGNNAIDAARSQAQWEGVRQAFAAAGFGLLQVEAAEGLEDMVFAANQTFVGVVPDGKPFVVVSYMRHESRRREVQHYRKFFEQRGFEVIDLRLPAGEFIEGGGDLLWNTDMQFVWAGYGFRSTKAGIEAFTGAMMQRNVKVVPLELRDERFYHLDTCLAPLTADSVLIYPGAFSENALKAIRASVKRVHEVSEQEALKFICNGVSANGRFITGALPDSLQRALQAEKLEAVVVDTSEFEKSGGSVCCLKMFVP